MADVIAIWEILFQIILCYFRLMLLPFNFLLQWQMLLPMTSGRCYTTKADVIAYYIFVLYYGWCYYYSCGRCYYHFVFNIYMADVIAMYVWQML